MTKRILCRLKFQLQRNEKEIGNRGIEPVSNLSLGELQKEPPALYTRTHCVQTDTSLLAPSTGEMENQVIAQVPCTTHYKPTVHPFQDGCSLTGVSMRRNNEAYIFLSERGKFRAAQFQL